MTGFKTFNEYARAIRPEVYEKMPKAVLAAIAVAFAAQLEGGHIGAANTRIVKEWAVLHANGIVPQKPFTH